MSDEYTNNGPTYVKLGDVKPDGAPDIANVLFELPPWFGCFHVPGGFGFEVGEVLRGYQRLDHLVEGHHVDLTKAPAETVTDNCPGLSVPGGFYLPACPVQTFFTVTPSLTKPRPR